MKKLIIAAIAGLTILVFTSCAPVKFYSNSLKALAALISKSSAAITDLASLKGIPPPAASATVIELYEVFMGPEGTTIKKVEFK